MNYVYRYTDLSDGIIKYVGIVCRNCENSLQKRIAEHSEMASWTFNKAWKIEYIEVETLNDANALEAHFIAKYSTGEWYNSSKTKLGLLTCINDCFEWKVASGSLLIEEKEINTRKKDKSKEILELKEMMSRRLSEIENSLKTIDCMLINKDYSKFSEKQLVDDKKELDSTYKKLLSFELSRPLIIL